MTETKLQIQYNVDYVCVLVLLLFGKSDSWQNNQCIYFTKPPLCFHFLSVSLNTSLRIDKWNWTGDCTLATKIPSHCSHGTVTCRPSWQLHFTSTETRLACFYAKYCSSQLSSATASQQCSNLEKSWCINSSRAPFHFCKH